MAIFTTIAKQRLSWPAREVVLTTPEVDFIFSDGSDFLFSDNTDYVFVESSEGRNPTSWTLPTKKRLTWQN